MKVLTDRGIVDLDLEKIALEILANKGRAGYTADAIAAEIELKYHTAAVNGERIHKILESSKVAKYSNGKWHAPDNAVMRLMKQRALGQARLQSNRFKVKVRYTKRGCARIIVPKSIIEKLGKPSEIYVKLSGDTVQVS